MAIAFFLGGDVMGSKWMVDCHGSNGEGDQKAMQICLADLDFAAFLERHGSLAVAVQNEIESLGLQASDRGGGNGSWHVGVPFAELADAATYLGAMTTRFKRAIAADLLRFSLKTWSKSEWRKD